MIFADLKISYNFKTSLMKNNILFFVLFIFLAISSCSSSKTLPDGKQIDKRLIGVWEGSEKDHQISGVEKKWTMERKEDGTFSLHFVATKDGRTNESTEEGNWWVEGTTFFEYHEYSKKTDLYKFTILNKKQVKFTMTDSYMAFNNANYTFIDTKISNVRKDKVKRDGLTLETAIIVKSVEEEYKYVKKKCQNCQGLSQSVMESEGMYLDVLKYRKEDGKEILYYFDITSFYDEI